MFTQSQLLVALFLISLASQTSSATCHPVIAPALVATTGAAFLGIGGMFAGFAVKDERDTRALYNTTELVVTNYTVSKTDCRTYQGRSSTLSPYTARSINSYQAYTHDIAVIYETESGLYCASTSEEALGLAQRSSPIGSAAAFLYLISDPTTVVQKLHASGYWVAMAVFFAMGVPTTAAGVFLAAATIRHLVAKPS